MSIKRDMPASFGDRSGSIGGRNPSIRSGEVPLPFGTARSVSNDVPLSVVRNQEHMAKVAALKAELTEDIKQLNAVVKQRAAKLMMLEKMETKTRSQKLDMLFSLWDRDGSGALVFSELAAGIRKMLSVVQDVDMDQIEMSTFAKEGAVTTLTELGSEAVAGSDAGRVTITRDSFEQFINAVCSQINTDFEVVAELLVLQYFGWSKSDFDCDNIDYGYLKQMEEKAERKIRLERQLRETLESEHLRQLFRHFDRNQDVKVDFKELAMGLDSLRAAPDIPFETSTGLALKTLVIFDLDSSRSLDYNQFARFVLTFAAAARTSVQMLATHLLQAATRNTAVDTPALLQGKCAVIDQMVLDLDRRPLAATPDLRGDALFALFDRDGNGYVDFKELALGLKMFNPSEGLQKAAQAAMRLLLAHDSNDDQRLDRAEFDRFIVEFCATLAIDNDELAQFQISSALVSFIGLGSDLAEKRRDSALLAQMQPVAEVEVRTAQFERAASQREASNQ